MKMDRESQAIIYILSKGYKEESVFEFEVISFYGRNRKVLKG